jgi:hypothetical protein
MMLNRLRRYYKGFYKQFGCYLWMANVLLTFPLMFRALFDALAADETWYQYWIGSNNFYRATGYNFLLFFFATYIPMLMQISSLIFGFVRRKQVRVFRSYRESADANNAEGSVSRSNRD